MSDEQRTETDSNRGGFDMTQLAGERWPAPAWHAETIKKEMSSDTPKHKMMSVVKRMAGQTVPDFSGIDWDAELAGFEDIDYPTYYRQPFHSVPGGYLSEAAAVGDRGAMEAIYEEWHPRKSLGLRCELAALVPEDAKTVVDLGGGTGDMGAELARRLPEAQVRSIDASPFMLIAGRVQNKGIANLALEHGFAESTEIEDGSVDVVTITLVFHEVPDVIKAKILGEVFRILRPGGTLVLSDTPNDDLHGFRGFYEPYKEEWLDFDPDAALTDSGFVELVTKDVAPPLWTRIARKPA